MIVLDVSAWLKKVLRREADVDRLDALIAAHLKGKQQILIPFVAWAEVLWFLTERIKLSWPDVRQALRDLSIPHLTVAGPSRRLLLASTKIGERYGIKNPDTVYVALAELRRCELVTADREMFRRLRDGGIGWVHLLRDYAV